LKLITISTVELFLLDFWQKYKDSRKVDNIKKSRKAENLSPSFHASLVLTNPKRTHCTVAPNRTARGLATMGLYEIVEALLLLTNAVAILNEDRFLAPCKPCSRLSTPAVSVCGIFSRIADRSAYCLVWGLSLSELGF
jgi:hypothetical protein